MQILMNGCPLIQRPYTPAVPNVCRLSSGVYRLGRHLFGDAPEFYTTLSISYAHILTIFSFDFVQNLANDCKGDLKAKPQNI